VARFVLVLGSTTDVLGTTVDGGTLRHWREATARQISQKEQNSFVCENMRPRRGLATVICQRLQWPWPGRSLR
jgi:hypothetical protein